MTAPLDEQLTMVLLTYNCAHRIGVVLDCLAALKLPVVVVDNASADETPNLIAEHPEFQFVRLARNLGAVGRNVGTELARTPYVAFCDDDEWWERNGLQTAVELLQRHDQLAVVNARILVNSEQYLDPISAEMQASPLPDRVGLPGAVVLGFMAGGVVFRRSAYLEVGGYDSRFFMGGEEETLAFKLMRRGWQMRYVPTVVMYHLASVENAGGLRAFGMRNTIWNAWLHRRPVSALRWTTHTLLERRKDRAYLHALQLALAGLPWVLANRSAMPRALDHQVSVLDRGHVNRRRETRARPGAPLRSWLHRSFRFRSFREACQQVEQSGR